MDGEPARMWKYFLHLGTLASLSLAQPIFDLLSQYPQFLVAHHAGPIEIWLLVLLLCLIVPGSVAAVEWLQNRTMGETCKIRGAGIALFVFPLSLMVLKYVAAIPAIILVVIAVVLTWLSSRAYLRYRIVRLYLTFLAPAVLVVPVLFVTGSSVQRIVAPAKQQGAALVNGVAETPIVMVVFDELSVQSLLDRHGKIDAARFPNFHDFSRQATWYRNTTTVSYSTQYSVPAMLTGNRPKDPTVLPILAEHPNNLFNWLRNSHRLNVFESTTNLCPELKESQPRDFRRMLPLLADLSVVYLHFILPEQLTSGLPDVRHGWTVPKLRGWSDNPIDRFGAFLEALPKDGKPGLNFIHVQVPHQPWIYLPSGKRYLPPGKMRLFLPRREIWTQDEGLVTLAFQRHLLQVGLADRLLGRLIGELKEARLYDRSLMIIVSDHGISFQPGGYARELTRTNFKDILAVPLLIKTPYQTQGRVSDRHTRTTDVFPSIAEYLGVPTPWQTDGIPVTDPTMLKDRDLASTAASNFPPSKSLSHRTTVCMDGTAIEVRQDGVLALLEIVEETENKISFSGFAADMTTLKPADSILLFVDGGLVYRGMSRRPRPEVVEYFESADLENSGFFFELKRELFEGSLQVRCFAVSGDQISEVRYPERLPWTVEPNPALEVNRSKDLEPVCSADQDARGSFLITHSLGLDDLRATDGPSQFAAGLRELAWNAGPDGFLKLGPSASLLGKSADQLPVTMEIGLEIDLDQPRFYDNVQLDAAFIPAAIEGRVSATDAKYVAVAVNGTLRAFAPTFEGSSGWRRFQAIVPETSFLNGANRIRVFAVAQTYGRLVLLSPPESP